MITTDAETVTSNEHNDAWTCVCGNDTMADGFAPCDPETGNTVEPVLNGPWDTRSVVCLSCRRVMDQSSHRSNPDATSEWDSHLVTVARGPRDDVDPEQDEI